GGRGRAAGAEGATAPPAVRAADGRPSPAATWPSASGDLARAIEVLRSFIRTLESKAEWRNEIRRLREELARQHNPFQRLAVVEAFLRKAAIDSRDVAEAFSRLKREA